MIKIANTLEHFPVATAVHLIVAIVLGIDLLIDGNLSQDALTYSAIVETGNGLVAIGRGQSKRTR